MTKTIQRRKDRIDKWISEQYADCLTSFDDLVGDGYTGMSNIFYLWNRRHLHWLDNNPDVAVSEQEIRFRRKFFRVLQKVGPSALKCTQVFENRKIINDPTAVGKDDDVILPETPVVFVSNHGFHDDVLATVLAAGRHAYIAWGSLPLLFNTKDGFASSLVGTVCVNRNNKKSRQSFLAKALNVMEHGTDIILFPEGTWNKTSEKPVLDLWKGVYDVSLASKCAVIPIVHYVRDMESLKKKNIIHTVVDDPVMLYEMSQREALKYLRDVLASWHYKMAERYGKAERATEMQGFDTSDEKWKAHLEKRMRGVDRYDYEVETKADFRSPEVARPEDVFRPIANLLKKRTTATNIKMILDAKRIVEERTQSDFQRRF